MTKLNNVIGTALDHLRKKLERKSLEKSANLYAEIYEGDSEIKELTESAIAGWAE